MIWTNVCYELEECVLCSLKTPVVVYVKVYIVCLCSTSSDWICFFIMPSQIHVMNRHTHV